MGRQPHLPFFVAGDLGNRKTLHAIFHVPPKADFNAEVIRVGRERG